MYFLLFLDLGPGPLSVSSWPLQAAIHLFLSIEFCISLGFFSGPLLLCINSLGKCCGFHSISKLLPVLINLYHVNALPYEAFWKLVVIFFFFNYHDEWRKRATGVYKTGSGKYPTMYWMVLPTQYWIVLCFAWLCHHLCKYKTWLELYRPRKYVYFS